jgi:predicted transcriptional regulator
MSRSSRSHRGRGGQGGHEPRARIRTRERRALELAVQGSSQHQIASDLGISQAAVSKLLTRVEARVLRDLAETLERQKARHTLRLEHLYSEAMRAWTDSQADATRRRQRKSRGGRGEATVAEIVTENQHGDPRYLDEARKMLADLRKLWGLDAPQKVDLRAARNPYGDLSEDALREEIARQERLLSSASAGPADTATIDVTPTRVSDPSPKEAPDGD